ncbi:MAG TPA: DUF3261 domain-containing protein [Burkholderiaceae bacterium]|nr:DUF3261 domain-containing protein [Burkholderiaceae bacterium]
MSARVSSCLAILALLAGCASDPRCPPLPGGPRYCLQGTAAVAPHVALQDIRIRRGELDERLIAQLEVDAAGMHLAGLTPMGQRILEAHFDNKTASASSLAGDRLDARALLSLVQLATWPAESVRAGLGDDCILAETPALRHLLRDGRPIMDVVRTGEPPEYQRLEISLPEAGMTVTVQAIKEE